MSTTSIRISATIAVTTGMFALASVFAAGSAQAAPAGPTTVQLQQRTVQLGQHAVQLKTVQLNRHTVQLATVQLGQQTVQLSTVQLGQRTVQLGRQDLHPMTVQL